MNTEITKTICFLAAAVGLGAAAFFTRPAPPAKTDTQVVGQKLFPEFTSPEAVDRLTVLQYDQKASKPIALEVAKINDLWVIPSHGKYPADAKAHLADAANSLIGLKILGVAPGFDPGSPALKPEDQRARYNQYGVVDPDPDNVKSTDTGIGTRITMKDGAGHDLASAIIGKKLGEEGDQCYVRKAGKEQETVYIVQLDPSKLSVKFTDWIEPNLLNLNSMDLKQVSIDNYTIQPVLDRDGSIALSRASNGSYRLDLPSGEQPWKLVDEQQYDRTSHKMVPRALAADEEVNATNLDALKSALEDLKIVNVERKPAQVPANLQVRGIDEDTRATLMERGFFAFPVDEKNPDAGAAVLSKYGEIDLQLNDGACYVLRFGNTKGESAAAAKGKKGAAAADTESPGVDRYLFVMAEFRPGAVPKPAMEKLPDEKPAPAPEANKTEPKKTDAKAGEPKKEEPKKDDKKAEPGKDGAKDAAKDAAKKDEPKKPDPAEDAKKAADRKAEKERIEKENQRRQDEYNAKLAAGQKHVDDLNKRFAQWYYVIPGDVYAKIHLDRAAIVKKKEPPKDAHDHDHDHAHEHDLPLGPAGKLNMLPEK